MARSPPRAAQKPGFILRRRAEADLEEIGDYTLEDWGDAKLVEYMTMLNNAFRALAGDPNLGRSADDVREGYFRHHVGSHMVYFRRKKTGVEIVRILHETMSPARHL
jgi:toxin ParE1/3/4